MSQTQGVVVVTVEAVMLPRVPEIGGGPGVEVGIGIRVSGVVVFLIQLLLLRLNIQSRQGRRFDQPALRQLGKGKGLCLRVLVVVAVVAVLVVAVVLK